MVQNDQYNIFLIVGDHLGPLLDHFRKKTWFFAPKHFGQEALCVLGAKNLLLSEKVQIGASGSKWSQMGPFWTTSGHWQACHVWSFLVPNGPFFTHLCTSWENGKGQNCFKTTSYMCKDYSCAMDSQSKHIYGHNNQKNEEGSKIDQKCP